MKYVITIVGLVMICASSALAATGDGYDAIMIQKTDMFMNKEKIATIPELALFKAHKIRGDWVFGIYVDVDNEESFTGWIKMDGIADVDKMKAALKAQSENYLLDGERRYQEKKYAEAIRLFSESLDRYPEQPHTLKLRADCYIFLGKNAEAGRDYSTIIETALESPEAVDAFLGRARIYIQMKQYQRAGADLQQVIKKDPRNAEAYLYQGDIQYALGRFQQAVEFYGKGVQMDPKMSSLFYKRGMTYYRLSMFDESLKDLNQAVDLNKENQTYRNALGTVEQYVKSITNISPEEVKRALSTSINEGDDKIVVSITNRLERPLLNIEVAMAIFVEDTFNKEKEERMGGSGTRDFSRGRIREEDWIERLEIEVYEMKVLPGKGPGSNQNTWIVNSKSFAQQLSKENKKYYGYIVMLFSNKQPVTYYIKPRSVERKFGDSIDDLKRKVQGEQAN